MLIRYGIAFWFKVATLNSVLDILFFTPGSLSLCKATVPLMRRHSVAGITKDIRTFLIGLSAKEVPLAIIQDQSAITQVHEPFNLAHPRCKNLSRTK